METLPIAARVSIVERFRAAYITLEREVFQATRLHLGDTRRLQVIRTRIFSFNQVAQQVSVKNKIKAFGCSWLRQHSSMFDATEWAILQENLTQMVATLDTAEHESVDPPDGEAIVLAQHLRLARRGRPRIQIDVNALQYAMELRSNTALAEVFGCSSRTIRRQALENGLVAPNPPVRTQTNHSDGTRTIQHVSYTPAMANLSDQEIDQILGDILQIFPSFGCQMIIAQFQLYGYRVSRQWICDSYIRVVGPPPEFGGQ